MNKTDAMKFIKIFTNAYEVETIEIDCGVKEVGAENGILKRELTGKATLTITGTKHVEIRKPINVTD